MNTRQVLAGSSLEQVVSRKSCPIDEGTCLIGAKRILYKGPAVEIETAHPDVILEYAMP